MKELKKHPILYNDFTRLIKNISNDVTRPQLSGIYNTESYLVTTNGFTMFITSRLPTFQKENCVIDIAPIAKTFKLEHFRDYNLIIEKEFPNIGIVLNREKFPIVGKIILPDFLEELEKSKKEIKLYFDNETFALHQTKNTSLIIDGKYLAKCFPLDAKDQEIYFYNSGTMLFLSNSSHYPWQDKKLQRDTWLFAIMSFLK